MLVEAGASAGFNGAAPVLAPADLLKYHPLQPVPSQLELTDLAPRGGLAARLLGTKGVTRWAR